MLDPCVNYCKNAMDQSEFLKQAYFKDLRNGKMALEHFQYTQEQFFFAVDFFSRPMCALLARLDDPLQRCKILENVLEEHGNFDQKRFHSSTFKAFLKSIHAQDDVNTLAAGPEVSAFNSILLNTCSADAAQKAIACLGAIEFAFAHISNLIGRTVIQNSWIHDINKLQHYTTHSELDFEHAQDFFDLIESDWNEPAKQELIQQGLDLGLFIFARLYEDLYRAAIAKTKKARTQMSSSLSS
jgi:pyrroloquinoline-quinone synthase